MRAFARTTLGSLPRPSEGRTPPRLEIVVELEELPRLRLVADTFEDEQRLRGWLAHGATRNRLRDAVLDALELSEAA
jgi:hypothetical protein